MAGTEDEVEYSDQTAEDEDSVCLSSHGMAEQEDENREEEEEEYIGLPSCGGSEEEDKEDEEEMDEEQQILCEGSQRNTECVCVCVCVFYWILKDVTPCLCKVDSLLLYLPHVPHDSSSS